MKTSRRSFLKLGAAASVLTPLIASGQSVAGKPVVISTWNFGLQANQAAWKILSVGGRALDAVEAGARVPEADPANTTVGLGGAPDREGIVTLDACIMDEHGGCGSVVFLEDIMHPISVARMVMEKTPHVMLAGAGAKQFALANGFKKDKLLTPESEQAWKTWLKESKYKPVVNIENHDTIGILAMDQAGNLSGGCTTSGMAYKMRGRIGDSPIIGAGLYVDNEIGAATATGVGEEVIRVVGSHLVVELMRQGYAPQDACREAVERIVRKNSAHSKDIQVGFIALSKSGTFGAYCLQPGFNFAVYNQDGNNLFDSASYYK
jgi:N4-(beta-N-acetylglucosaminyl)-L-asparaginase